MKWQTLKIVILFVVSAPLFASDNATLTVAVTGVTPDNGEVVVSLFDRKKTWLKKPLLERREEVRENDTEDVIFDGLATGEYAVSIYYDPDGDGEMDTGLIN